VAAGMAQPPAVSEDALRQARERLGAATSPVLLRLPFSHFCRKAEWGLTRAGVPYSTIDLGVRQMPQVRRANPVERTVPVLAEPRGLVHGSHAILRWADDHRTPSVPSFYPDASIRDVIAWEAWADNEVGPVVARVAARIALKHPTAYGRSTWGKVRMRLARPAFRAVARHLDADAHATTDDKALPGLIANTVDRLRDTDTGFLVTEHATGADLATAALFAPVMRVGARVHLDEVDGWGELVQFIRTVRPARLRRTGTRKVREADWRAFETLLKAQATLPRPLAGQD
jgi:glutathione S-transferase